VSELAPSKRADSTHPELRHFNRDDFISYPDGVAGLGDAIQHRIEHAGLTRKVGKNQVLALNVLLSSDGEALRRLADEGRLNEWAEASVGWAKETFGAANVMGAHLHMDEQTPHLHVTVVPIVTTERRRKASEAKATKRYRTKPKNDPRLSADDIMTRDNLTSFQDTYAKAMERFGLERGVRGSEARHVDQHEYYRDCQRKKKDLEIEVAELTTEKKKVSREKKALETSKEKIKQETNLLIGKNEIYKTANERLCKDKEALTEENSILVTANDRLIPKVTEIVERNDQLEKANAKLADDIARLEMQKMRKVQDADLVKYKSEIERLFPDIPDLLTWANYCKHIGFTEGMTQKIIAMQPVRFSGLLYSSEHSQSFTTEHSVAQLEREPNQKHSFVLKIDGVSVFQWFRDMARKLLEKMGFRQPQPKQGKGLHH